MMDLTAKRLHQDKNERAVEMANLYTAGATLEELASKYNTRSGVIHRLLTRRGFTFRKTCVRIANSKRVTRKSKVLERYASGLSSYAIARQEDIGLDCATICKILNENGAEIRGRKEKHTQLVGSRFARLVVVSRAPNKRHHAEKGGSTYSNWECLCDCGRSVTVKTSSLIDGTTKSCGCYHRDTLTKSDAHVNLTVLYNNYKSRAHKSDRSFGLSITEFSELISKVCHYCGAPPAGKVTVPHRKTVPLLYNGLDRVDNGKGYDLGNVVPCCADCNRGKRIMSREEFMAWITRIYDYSIKNQVTLP